MKAIKTPKERLDKLLTDRGLVESRTKAQAVIMAGQVKVSMEGDSKAASTPLKAGTLVPLDCTVSVDEAQRWVSRGAFKLLKALDIFSFTVSGKTCVDIGASTGGFTDVLLDAGAKKVYAVDVGYGQLHWKLASDSRVVVMDRTNARYLTPEMFGDALEVAVCDASFISLRLILPAIDGLLSIGGEAVTLIKPQFEAGRDRIGRGVVKDEKVHADVLRSILGFIKDDTGLEAACVSWSPIKGQEGNIEFLCHLRKTDDKASGAAREIDVDALVMAAHQELQTKNCDL
ncbi:TlyA family rRNA (cytidine-2'-O)-methyltransferase [Synergistales bacterium]|nr:TlyA family rRNA (cytidine-2'-O)-methyltransferase [Synergistales bacterium]